MGNKAAMSEGEDDVEVSTEDLAAADPEARALFEEMLARGWHPKVRDGGQSRYRLWCPGPCEHGIWIALSPRSISYVQRQINHLDWTTCWNKEV